MCLPLSLFTSIFLTHLSLDMELTLSVRHTGQQASTILLSRPHSCRAYKYGLPHPAFDMGGGELNLYFHVE